MAAKTKRLIVGNWKMYVQSLEDARAFAGILKRKARNFADTEIWLASPTPFVAPLAAALKGSTIRVGAQTVSADIEGAHTGEVSARMLRDAGATFSIVGHSERRLPADEAGAAGENDVIVAAELNHALAAGLQTILCVGEHVRDEHGGHYEFIASQLRSALESAPAAFLNKIVIAYEPIWAIGQPAEAAAQPELVRETAIFIRKMLVEILGRDVALKTPILYGGSVEGENAATLIHEGEVNGFLVGRASAAADTFVSIIAACSQGTEPVSTKQKQPRKNTKKPKSKNAISKMKKKRPKRK